MRLAIRHLATAASLPDSGSEASQGGLREGEIADRAMMSWLQQEGRNTMWRKRVRKVVLVVVGLIIIAGIYPLATSVRGRLAS